jgi:hypothetical protein
MGRLTNVLLSFLPGRGRGKAGSRPPKSLSGARHPKLEALEDRIFPSVMVFGNGLGVETSASPGQTSGPAAATQPAPPAIPAIPVGSRSSAGDSPRTVGVVVDAVASAQGGAAVRIATCGVPLPFSATARVTTASAARSLNDLVGTVQAAAGGLAASWSGPTLTLWLDQFLAGLTQTAANFGEVASLWVSRFADVARSWAARVVDVANVWIPRALAIGNSWVRQAQAPVAATVRLDVPLDPNQPADLVVSSQVTVGRPGDPPGVLPDRPGCGATALLVVGLLSEPSLASPDFGTLPEGSLLPPEASLLQGLGGSGGGGGGGGDSDSQNHKPVTLTFTTPPGIVIIPAPPGFVVPPNVFVPPVVPRRSGHPPRSASPPDDDDPEMNDPGTGDGNMDDPDGDGSIPDESGGAGDTSSSTLVAATPHHPGRDDGSGQPDGSTSVVVGIASQAPSPGATSSTAVKTNVTVLVGIVMPASPPDTCVEAADESASPAPVAGEGSHVPPREKMRLIADQLAEVRLAWPVHRSPTEAAFPGPANPLPITDQLAELPLAWPVHHPLLEAIILAAVTPRCGCQDFCRPEPDRDGRGAGGPGRTCGHLAGV